MGNIGRLVEHYRMIIGLALIVLILSSGIVLIWKLNGQNKSDELDDLRNQVQKLESKVQLIEQQDSVKSESSTQPSVPISPPATAESGQIAGVSVKSGLININTASLAELDSLPGIGPVYAQRIIDYRNQNGGFKTIDEVKNVKGIGEKTLAKFRDKITVN